MAKGGQEGEQQELLALNRADLLLLTSALTERWIDQLDLVGELLDLTRPVMRGTTCFCPHHGTGQIGHKW